MARKTTDVVSPNLRIRESLRRQLEKAAENHHVSLNKEMTMRLEDSFEKDALRSINSVAANLTNINARCDAREMATGKLGDLVRAAEALLKQIAAGNYEATTKAATKVAAVIKMIDTMRALELRRASVDGVVTQ